jgi:hypothetical protein
MKNQVALAVTLLTALNTLMFAQERLVDVLKRTKGDIEFTRTREFSPADLPDLVRASDTVVRVVAGTGLSRISEDELSIETDYSVTVLDVYGARSGLVQGSRIVVTKPGGSLTIDGRAVRAFEPDFPALVEGTEYILFLVHDPRNGRFVVSHGGQGAFQLITGEFEQVSKHDGKSKSERGRIPFAPFVDEVRGLVAALP